MYKYLLVFLVLFSNALSASDIKNDFETYAMRGYRVYKNATPDADSEAVCLSLKECFELNLQAKGAVGKVEEGLKDQKQITKTEMIAFVRDELVRGLQSRVSSFLSFASHTYEGMRAGGTLSRLYNKILLFTPDGDNVERYRRYIRVFNPISPKDKSHSASKKNSAPKKNKKPKKIQWVFIGYGSSTPGAGYTKVEYF